MKLICVGGEKDGEWVNVEDHYRIGDMIRVASNAPIEMVWQTDEPPAELKIQYAEYCIACIHFTIDDVYKFLVPIGMNQEQVIKAKLENR